VEQVAPASAVPQLAQKRPEAAAPQEGQGEEGFVTRESYNDDPRTVNRNEERHIEPGSVCRS
jgi:hypothetical protein